MNMHNVQISTVSLYKQEVHRICEFGMLNLCEELVDCV